MTQPALAAATPRQIQRTYLTLLLCSTLAASFIWGINTLFLLDAGLSNMEAFAANAFFTVGQVLFEVPTGVVADTRGRRVSYLLGAATLLISTLLYLLLWQIEAPFVLWALVSAFLGLGFTFFSGATEAWLVDALAATGYKQELEKVFAKGQIVMGIAMLAGSVGGGIIAQATNLGVPYLVRSGFLLLTFALAWLLMRDLGFTPARTGHPIEDTQHVLRTSIQLGLKNPPVRWVMLASPFLMGVSFYAFYAMQPFLLELYGDTTAYSVAGLAAAIVAGAQIFGGLVANRVRRLFARRTSLILTTTALGAILLGLIALSTSFYTAIFFLVLWALLGALAQPVRQAYLNGLIPSAQRATVLSFDSLMGSSGGVVIQPILGRAADAWSYGTSYIIGAGMQALALPFLLLARREKPTSDFIERDLTETTDDAER